MEVVEEKCMKQKVVKKWASATALSIISLTASGCASQAYDVLNPYGEDAPEGAGQRNLKTLIEETGGGGEADRARHALEVATTYRRAQDPQPTYPVMQPAEVRLMWVPDHLNKAGDLVPAHYYYLRVLNERWAVQDAFEIEQQLNDGSQAGSATPWVYKDGKK